MQNKKTTNDFRTLAKIRERKEELLEEIQKDRQKQLEAAGGKEKELKKLRAKFEEEEL